MREGGWTNIEELVNEAQSRGGGCGQNQPAHQPGCMRFDPIVHLSFPPPRGRGLSKLPLIRLPAREFKIRRGVAGSPWGPSQLVGSGGPGISSSSSPGSANTMSARVKPELAAIQRFPPSMVLNSHSHECPRRAYRGFADLRPEPGRHHHTGSMFVHALTAAETIRDPAATKALMATTRLNQRAFWNADHRLAGI